MRCYVYILVNKGKQYYVGITKLPLKKRLQRHNNGDIRSTRNGKHWKLLYFEKFADYKRAREREKQIKNWHSGNAFKKLVTKAAGSSKGRTQAFGACYDGSNPSPAALVASKNKHKFLPRQRRGEVGLLIYSF